MTDHPSRPPAAPAWPVLAWLPGYQRSGIPLDVIAGLTVCAILVREGMAYARLAGMPLETAFYAAPIALLAYAILPFIIILYLNGRDVKAAFGLDTPPAA